MDPILIFIPVALVVLGIVAMVVLNKKGKQANGVSQQVMQAYAKEQLPQAADDVRVINLLDDGVGTSHIWVVAYESKGMHIIPTVANPFTRTMERYTDQVPLFHLKKQLASHILGGDKTEDIEYVPYNALTSVKVDAQQKKIRLQIGETAKTFRYQSKDCFGKDQEEALAAFLGYLNK